MLCNYFLNQNNFCYLIFKRQGKNSFKTYFELNVPKILPLILNL